MLKYEAEDSPVEMTSTSPWQVSQCLSWSGKITMEGEAGGRYRQQQRPRARRNSHQGEADAAAVQVQFEFLGCRYNHVGRGNVPVGILGCVAGNASTFQAGVDIGEALGPIFIPLFA